jgi:EAL domain-containing protein (putative c-di-GMP-specific phosphodiesterase class I)/ketosteroid isomerase-like protein
MIEVALNAFPIRDLDGRVVGVSTTAKDITERRRLEERERQDREGHMWRRSVRRALDRRHLELFGQPIVEPRSGKVDHHELLLRMRLDGEIVPPGAFLPHVEDHDLITEIDSLAIRRGAELARRTPVAINLSARSLSSARLLPEVERAFGDTGLTDRVTFEITETAAIENLEAAGILVKALTDLGCGVALDDFGTGYGSFTYLKHLPVTELKIDIEFVRGMATNTADRRVVESIIAIARTFGMRSVAEGVENAETLADLESLGVDLAQGFYLGAPAPMDEAAPSGQTDVAAPSRDEPAASFGPRAAVVVKLLAAISAGERETALDLVAPDTVWTPTAWSGARTFHGREGVKTWMKQFGSDLSQLAIEPIEVEERGDDVIVLGKVRDHRRGLDFAMQVAWAFRVADGLITEGQAYLTLDEARKAPVS